MIDKVIVIVKIYYPMHLIKCLDNRDCYLFKFAFFMFYYIHWVKV